ncbi:hypothetical protein Tcan_12728 [Toxocara canis]|uniref:Ras family protein n=2 Tax=Toxocara canis TaxID=6265 RepID=A0A0B2W1H8_TOXCA|nr:hypothetical protein Tcan_12728 [Toxocara canis]VDM36398.1 unnamed protein product [Toxocara canis]
MTHKGGEIRITFIGSPQKSVIFEQLKEAAIKTEKHVSYQDTFYFTFNVDGTESVVELFDPGVEHTGAREMSIRNTNGVMLFYSAYSPASFKQISDVISDFSYRKNNTKLPVLLICIEDEIMEDCCETASTDQSSVSEGYESETPNTLPMQTHWKRRRSMEKIRDFHEDGKISREKGKQLARMIPADCEFIPITLSSFTDSAKLMGEMIRRIRGKQSNKRPRLLSLAISNGQKIQALAERRGTTSCGKSASSGNAKVGDNTVVSSTCTIS